MKNPILYKAEVVAKLRDYLSNEGFIEIFTPVMRRFEGDSGRKRIQVEHGRFLRESPALALRYNLQYADRIFEIGPCFRPDKSDATHLSEFTMLDSYTLGESMEYLSSLVNRLIGLFYSGTVKRLSVAEFIKSDFGVDLFIEPENILTDLLRKKYKYSENLSTVDCIDRYIKTEIEHQSKDCCLYLEDFPLSLEVRAKRRNLTAAISERFEVLINGIEVAHGYQDEPNADEFIDRAQEYGLFGPEDGIICEHIKSGIVPSDSIGFGIGIERLCQVCYDENHGIKEFMPSQIF